MYKNSKRQMGFFRLMMMAMSIFVLCVCNEVNGMRWRCLKNEENFIWKVGKEWNGSGKISHWMKNMLLYATCLIFIMLGIEMNCDIQSIERRWQLKKEKKTDKEIQLLVFHHTEPNINAMMDIFIKNRWQVHRIEIGDSDLQRK